MDIKHARSDERYREIALEWPIVVDGVDWKQIGIRRLTVADVAAFAKEVDAGAVTRAPVFVGPDGAPVPDEIWSALDPDDSGRLMEASQDFLPRAFRAAPANSPVAMSPASDVENGEIIGLTSAPSADGGSAS